MEQNVDVDLGDVTMSSLKGSLLVAVPLLEDPNFHRCVVYVLQHTDDGALGLVLNRPSNEDLIPGLESWMEELSHPRVIFDGGPVQVNTLIAIAAVDGLAADSDGFESDDADDLDGASSGFAPLDHGLGTVDLTQLPNEIAEGLQNLRVFRGYAGWGPGQLESELEEGSWLAVAYDAADLFTPNPRGLWRNVLRRSGGRTALLADAPDDLAWN